MSNDAAAVVVPKMPLQSSATTCHDICHDMSRNMPRLVIHYERCYSSILCCFVSYRQSQNMNLFEKHQRERARNGSILKYLEKQTDIAWARISSRFNPTRNQDINMKKQKTNYQIEK